MKRSNDYICGDIAYGYAFQETNDKNNLKLIQKPILGVLVRVKHEHEITKDSTHRPMYFVPFKKNTHDPAWSRAVSSSARYYDDTYPEAVNSYNNLIDKTIAYHQARIKEREKQKIL